MNLIKKISFFALAVVLFTSCKDTSKDGNIETPADSTATDTAHVKETAANLETTSFKIDGMTCAVGCAGTIEQKLSSMDGVETAKVDFENKTATVSFDADKQTPEKLVEKVEGIAGGIYKVSDVKNSGDKAFYSPEQEKPAKAKKTKKAKTATTSTEKDAKSDGCGTEKKGGCCSAGGAKTSCGSDSKAKTI